MPVTISEGREEWGRDVWAKAEEFANAMKSDEKPFYIVFAAKQDRGQPNAFRQAFRFYRQRPPKIIGVLVWFVDHKRGIFSFVPELSIPPDVPLDPDLLSTNSNDQFASVAEVGQKMGVILS